MPVFSLRKERFHPDLPLAQGFFVGCGWLIGMHPFQTGFIDTAAEAASLCARRTLRFDCAVITVPGSCPIAELSLGRMRAIKVQFFASRTHVDITLGFIGECLSTQELGTVIHIRNGNVRTNALVFNGNKVLFGAILLVTRHLPRPQFLAEAGPPEQVKHRLVIHHFGGRHQCCDDDASPTSIYHILRMVAQVDSSLCCA
jgi:hypothetical protein